MTIDESTPGTRVFVSAPNYFTIMGRQEQIPIKQFRRHLQVLNNIANRADHQNPYKTFELIDEETSTMACFGVGFGPGSRRVTEAKEESFHTIQPESSDDTENLVATEIDDTVPSQKMVGKDLSAIRDGFGVALPAAPKPILDSTVMDDTPGNTPTSDSSKLERRFQGFPATALQDQHVGNSACTIIIQAASTIVVPACSTSEFGTNDPGDFSRQSHLDSMARQALADANRPNHPPPEQAVAATPGKKVHRGLHAQPDFNYVQHEFNANGMSLKKLWHQYRQSHPNKRTYEYSQFCNRFKDWIASQAGTALSQGP